MKKKSVRDTVIGVLMVVTLCSSVIIVSCSEDGGISIGPNPSSNGSGPSSEAGQSSSPLAFIFGMIGKGALNTIGSDLTGWTLGALGLAGNSPDYNNQINLIINDLQEIINLLTDIDNELASINQTLQEMNCGEQTASIQTEVGVLNNLYNLYNGFVADTTDPIDTTLVTQWADDVINGTGSNPSVGQVLSTIKANLNLTSGALVSCIKTIPLPASGLSADTTFYDQVNAIVNYYYYYQSIGLFMLSEAYHYNAWRAAGSPGSGTYSADSVQAVCGVNSTTEFYCNEVQVNTNDLYNSLLTQLSYGGASYTNPYTILQYSTNNSVIWVRSLEDFTLDAGYTCTLPLNNSNLCGPAVGYYNTVLSDTVYRGTSGFNSFATSGQLISLYDNTVAQNFSTNGKYLEANGFQNMEGKTVISSSVENAGLYLSCSSFNFVPFILTDIPVVDVNPTQGIYNSVFYEGWGLSYLYSINYIYGSCGGEYQQTITSQFGPNSGITQKDSAFLTAYAISGVCEGCDDITIPFGFTNSNFSDKSNNNGPGYTQYSQNNGLRPKRFLFPVVSNALNVHCNTNRLPVNSGGMISMCGNDFVDYLNTNVPRPPTCDNALINPPCNNP